MMQNTDIQLNQTSTLEIINAFEDEDGFDRSMVAGYVMKLNKDREIKIETSSTYEKEIESEDISFYELSVVSNEEKNSYRFKIDYSHPFKSTVLDKKNLLEVGILDKQNGYNNIFNYNNDIKYDFNNSRNILAAYVDVSYYLKPKFSLKFGTRIENVIRDFKANSSSLSEDFIQDG